jgi:hypothetical protein
MAIDYRVGFGSRGAGHERLLRTSQRNVTKTASGSAIDDLTGYSSQWLIQPFQQPERVVGFFDTYRHLYPVSRDVLRGAADQFQVWVKEQADKWNTSIVRAPNGRRDDFVEPYFTGARTDQVVVVLKAREPARIMIAIGERKANRWHLQIADRWIIQYNFYVNDQHWGRCSCACAPIFRSRPGCASTNIAGWRTARRAHPRMLFCDVRRPSVCSSWPTPCSRSIKLWP